MLAVHAAVCIYEQAFLSFDRNKDLRIPKYLPPWQQLAKVHVCIAGDGTGSGSLAAAAAVWRIALTNFVTLSCSFQSFASLTGDMPLSELQTIV